MKEIPEEGFNSSEKTAEITDKENEKRKENTKRRYETMHFRDIIKEEEEFKSLISKDEEFIEVAQKTFAEYLKKQGLEFDGFYKLWRKKMKEEKKVVDEVKVDGFQKADLTKYLTSYKEFTKLDEKDKNVQDILKRKERTRDMYEFMDFREMNIEYGQFLNGVYGIYSDPAVEDIKQKTLVKLFQENDLDLNTFLEIRDRKEKEYDEEKEGYEKNQK